MYIGSFFVKGLVWIRANFFIRPNIDPLPIASSDWEYFNYPEWEASPS